MRVFIVTISFNQAQFLERAICSVVEHDYPGRCRDTSLARYALCK
jgi:hypothetical protein